MVHLFVQTLYQACGHDKGFVHNVHNSTQEISQSCGLPGDKHLVQLGLWVCLDFINFTPPPAPPSVQEQHVPSVQPMQGTTRLWSQLTQITAVVVTTIDLLMRSLAPDMLVLPEGAAQAVLPLLPQTQGPQFYLKVLISPCMYVH